MWLHRVMNSININSKAHYSVYCLGKMEFSEIGIKLFSSDHYIIVIFFKCVECFHFCSVDVAFFPLHFLH